MLDFPGGPLLLGKLDHRAAEHRVKIFLLVHIVNHAHVYVLRPQAGEQVGKSRLDLIYKAGAFVLPIDPGGAQMCLHNELLPAALHGLAEEVPDIELGVIEVEVVDPSADSVIQQLLSENGIFVYKHLAAKTDFADLQTSTAQSPVIDGSTLLVKYWAKYTALSGK